MDNPYLSLTFFLVFVHTYVSLLRVYKAKIRNSWHLNAFLTFWQILIFLKNNLYSFLRWSNCHNCFNVKIIYQYKPIYFRHLIIVCYKILPHGGAFVCKVLKSITEILLVDVQHGLDKIESIRYLFCLLWQIQGVHNLYFIMMK